MVDDNSPDKTSKLVEEKIPFHKERLFNKKRRKIGIGPAYINGFEWAIKNGYENIYEMDADFSHNQDLLECKFF